MIARRNLAIVLSVAFGLLAARASAAAELPPISVSAGYASEVFTSRSYDLVDSDDHLPMFRIGAGYQLRQFSFGMLDVEGAFHTGGAGESVHVVNTSGLAFRGVELGGNLRRSVWTHFEPYAHLGVGYDWATLTLNGGASLTQTVSRPAVNGMLGFQIPMPLALTENAPALIIDIGVGYTLRPGFGFHELRAPEPVKQPDDPIASAAVNVGTLPLSGISYRIGLTFRL
ncbi:MAG: hypothetical protein ACJ790_23320 [Myxococcaceae bacterium]